MNEICGVVMPRGASELEAHLSGLRLGNTNGWELPDRFWAVAELLWGKTECRLERNPWAERMIEEACEGVYRTGQAHFLGLAGCASSGKSRMMAAWGIVMWLCAPNKTSVIFTSTSIKEARQRIWGDVVALWDALVDTGIPPGKLVDSHNIIRFAPDGQHFKGAQRNSMMLVACAYGEERKAIKKLIGFKNDRVFLIGDELPDLPQGILKAALGNMSANARKGIFQMVGIGNPASKLDAFGKFIQPKDGWPTLEEDAEEWQGRYGTVLRFDAEKSPILDMDVVPKGWEFLPSRQSLEQDRSVMADEEWWRMNRAWFAPGGERDAAYTEDELMKAVEAFPGKWVGTPTPCASLDPAYKAGGDRIVATFGLCGQTTRKLKELHIIEAVEIPIPGDGPALFEMVEGFVEMCGRHGVEPWHTAIDETVGGSLVADALAIVWSQHVLRVNFGGNPSGRVCGVKSKRANEQFANRVGELWLGGKPLFHANQIWGLTQQHIAEMTRRKTASQRGARWSLLTVEPKKGMKKRTGRSPDYADSLFVLIELVQTRMGLLLDPERTTARDEDPEDWERQVEIGHLHNPDTELETLVAV